MITVLSRSIENIDLICPEVTVVDMYVGNLWFFAWKTRRNEEKHGKLTVGHEMGMTSDIKLGFRLDLENLE